MSVFMEALVPVAQKLRPPKCPPMDEQINKMWSRYTMGCYSALKRKEFPTPAATLMSLEDMLNEIRRIQKDTCYEILRSWSTRFQEMASRMAGAGARGGMGS